MKNLLVIIALLLSTSAFSQIKLDVKIDSISDHNGILTLHVKSDVYNVQCLNHLLYHELMVHQMKGDKIHLELQPFNNVLLLEQVSLYDDGFWKCLLILWLIVIFLLLIFS